jgi:hypothetical protein
MWNVSVFSHLRAEGAELDDSIYSHIRAAGASRRQNCFKWLFSGPGKIASNGKTRTP